MVQQIHAVRFRQWLDEWNRFEFDAAQGRRRPQEHIYLFSLPAIQLRALSGVYRRRRDGGPGVGLQRPHDKKRSRTIKEFVQHGYPYSSLNEHLRDAANESLKKPGWLPTAIVVNILLPDDERRGRKVAAGELIDVVDSVGIGSTLTVPGNGPLEKWVPSDLEPLEVIDGQHRLWAFDDDNGSTLPGDFELPVVAFRGLDIGWQAYLFWSINVSPKKINPSHAFDLFPLLRSETWLDKLSELRIYREARAQELTQLLYESPESPWYLRINMLGEKGGDAPERAGVTQAGWVRALTSSFLAAGGRGRSTDGLFAAAATPDGPLPWSRPQQAAFLIALWNDLKEVVYRSKEPWALALREEQTGFFSDHDLAFEGRKTILNQEQGVRGVLSVGNDLLFALARQDYNLFHWDGEVDAGIATTIEDVQVELNAFKTTHLASAVREICEALGSFDWRAASAPGAWDTEEYLARLAFRGSGGYTLFRRRLLEHIRKQEGRPARLANLLRV
jgi:hypothetical protein